jgi:hypothetical protein
MLAHPSLTLRKNMLVDGDPLIPLGGPSRKSPHAAPKRLVNMKAIQKAIARETLLQRKRRATVAE